MWDKVYGPVDVPSGGNIDSETIGQEPGNTNVDDTNTTNSTNTFEKPVPQRVYVKQVVPGVKFKESDFEEFLKLDAETWGIVAIVMMVLAFILLIVTGFTAFHWRKTKGKLIKEREQKNNIQF